MAAIEIMGKRQYCLAPWHKKLGCYVYVLEPELLLNLATLSFKSPGRMKANFTLLTRFALVYFQAKYCRRKKWTLLSWERFMTTKISRNVRYSAKSRFLDQSTFLVLPPPLGQTNLTPHFSNSLTRFFKPMFVQPLGSSKD